MELSVSDNSMFFLKQKTAYEMRISDWVQTCALPICCASMRKPAVLTTRPSLMAPTWKCSAASAQVARASSGVSQGRSTALRKGKVASSSTRRMGVSMRTRSEEHTAELQSLMRSTYAVFGVEEKTKEDNQQLRTL